MYRDGPVGYSGDRKMVEHVFAVGKEERQRMRINHSARTGKVTIPDIGPESAGD